MIELSVGDTTCDRRRRANSAHEALKHRPALVRLLSVDAVVDEIAVAVGDEQSKDKNSFGAGDGLELVDTARGVLEKLAVALECGEHEVSAFTEHGQGRGEIQSLELAWGVLQIHFVVHTVVSANEF
jgi:hypothetical protein